MPLHPRQSTRGTARDHALFAPAAPQDSLSNTTRVVLVACITTLPGWHADQTKHTLEFASRAARIVCRVAPHLGQYGPLLTGTHGLPRGAPGAPGGPDDPRSQRQSLEIDQLTKQLSSLKRQHAKLRLQNVALKSRNDVLTHRLRESQELPFPPSGAMGDAAGGGGGGWGRASLGEAPLSPSDRESLGLASPSRALRHSDGGAGAAARLPTILDSADGAQGTPRAARGGGSPPDDATRDANAHGNNADGGSRGKLGQRSPPGKAELLVVAEHAAPRTPPSPDQGRAAPVFHGAEYEESVADDTREVRCCDAKRLLCLEALF